MKLHSPTSQPWAINSNKFQRLATVSSILKGGSCNMLHFSGRSTTSKLAQPALLISKKPCNTWWHLSSVVCPSTSKRCPNLSQNSEAHLPNNWSIQYHLQNQLFSGLVAASLLSATILFPISNRLQFDISSDPYSSTTLLKNSYCWWKKSWTTWDAKNFLNNGINHQPQLVNAGFHPSTAYLTKTHQFDTALIRHGAPAADKRSRKDSTFSRWPKASCARWDARMLGRWKKMEYFCRRLKPMSKPTCRGCRGRCVADFLDFAKTKASSKAKNTISKPPFLDHFTAYWSTFYW